MNNCTKITIGCRTSMEVHMFDSFPSDVGFSVCGQKRRKQAASAEQELPPSTATSPLYLFQFKRNVPAPLTPSLVMTWAK